MNQSGLLMALMDTFMSTYLFLHEHDEQLLSLYIHITVLPELPDRSIATNNQVVLTFSTNVNVTLNNITPAFSL